MFGPRLHRQFQPRLLNRMPAIISPNSLLRGRMCYHRIGRRSRAELLNTQRVELRFEQQMNDPVLELLHSICLRR